MTRANPLANLQSDPDLNEDPLSNLNDFATKPAPVVRSPEARKIDEQIARERGFVNSKAEPVPEPPVSDKPIYYRNGRSEPLNFKVTKETKQHLHQLRDELQLPLGLLLEEALILVEEAKEKIRGKYPGGRK